jgi:hypothetical protein
LVKKLILLIGPFILIKKVKSLPLSAHFSSKSC